MASTLRTAPGMREKSPNVWELVVQAGRDPVTGKHRQVSRVFRGNLSEAKKARAALLTEVGKGRHTGTSATLDELYDEWILELRRKGRSPNTIHGYEKVYARNIKPTFGNVKVRKVTTKMLTDLYRAHQDRGLGPRSVYQIHACLSSMLSQACRWEWRDTNPAQWAQSPSIPNTEPVVPKPAEIVKLIKEAERSRKPEHARALFLAATTGLRRGELCALRRGDIDHDEMVLTVARSIAAISSKPIEEIPTKNRRIRRVALDPATLAILDAQIASIDTRAEFIGAALIENPFVFSDAEDASEPWRPDGLSQYFARLRERVGLDHLDFHYLRKFMETYGQNLGFSAAEVAMRAGHDPSVASKHYTGRVAETDRAIAVAVASLLSPGGGSSVVRAPDS